MSTAISPGFLAEPSCLTSAGVGHRELRIVSVEDDGVRETGNLAVIVADT